MLFYLGVFCCTQRDSIKFFGVQGLGNTCCSEPFLFHGKSLCTVVLGSYQNNIPKKVRLNKGPVPSQLFGIIGYSTVQYSIGSHVLEFIGKLIITAPTKK